MFFREIGTNRLKNLYHRMLCAAYEAKHLKRNVNET